MGVHAVWLGVVALLCGLPSLAAATLFVCGDATTFRGSTFADVSQPPTCPAPYALSAVPDAQAQAQMALITSLPRKYLKVPAGLVVEKTQPEKDATDAEIQAAQDEQQAYEDAATNNDLCNATLDEIRTRKGQLDAALQGDIDGITNIATAKTELTDMMGRLTGALLKLMECIRGRAGPPAP